MSDNNTAKLVNAFSSALGIDPSAVNENLEYQSIPEWDSISHMFLISELEHVFDIEIKADHILEIKSYSQAQQILKNYDIQF